MPVRPVSPPHDGPFGLERDDVVDAELGQLLNGQIGSVALWHRESDCQLHRGRIARRGRTSRLDLLSGPLPSPPRPAPVAQRHHFTRAEPEDAPEVMEVAVVGIGLVQVGDEKVRGGVTEMADVGHARPILADAMLHVVDRPPSAGGDDGQRPIVVLVHGTMDRSTSFSRVMDRLSDLHVVTYDRRGYGRSPRGELPVDVPAHVDDLLSVVAERRVVAVGHSLGGNLVLAAAARRPDLITAAGVYEAPLPWLDEWPATTAGIQAAADGVDPGEAAEQFMRKVVGDRVWDRLPARTRAARRAEGATLVAEMRSARAGPIFDPAAVNIPVVVARGSESAPHHHLSTSWLADRLADCETMIVDGAGHGGHASHPAEFELLVRRVLQRAADR